mgnify:CR=1 FL=1
MTDWQAISAWRLFSQMTKLFSFIDENQTDINWNNCSSTVRSILEGYLAGKEISVQDGIELFSSGPADEKFICDIANQIRKKKTGDVVSFVVNRNINFTNICYMGCKFCNFSKRIEDKGAEWLTLEQIVERAKEAYSRGATEICVQGGLHPKLSANFYRDILLSVKKEIPDLHIHAFSPFEIWYGASKSKLSYKDFLSDLKECGLDSMPGTAAEILDTDVRKQLTQNKLSTDSWVEIIKEAHLLGIPTSSTIMYGHIDGPEHWANHLVKLRNIQKDTKGFTELVPLSFVYKDSPLYLNNKGTVRKGPNTSEVNKMHAVSRLLLSGWIDNIQVSWTKLGLERASELLNYGVNDLGGTLMNESISRSAGSDFGQEITSFELVKLIRSIGKIPIQRTTLYQPLFDFSQKDPKETAPLVDRTSQKTIDFINQL